MARATPNRWGHMEDLKLIEARNKDPYGSWIEIAKKIKGRTPRQCRDRWEQQLRPDIKHTPWTDAEDKILLQKAEELNKRWEIIAKHLKGRTGIQCRNRYATLKAHEGKKVVEIDITSTTDLPFEFNENQTDIEF